MEWIKWMYCRRKMADLIQVLRGSRRRWKKKFYFIHEILYIFESARIYANTKVVSTCLFLFYFGTNIKFILHCNGRNIMETFSIKLELLWSESDRISQDSIKHIGPAIWRHPSNRPNSMRLIIFVTKTHSQLVVCVLGGKTPIIKKNSFCDKVYCILFHERENEISNFVF